jgi:hypothetical protein
MSSDRHGPAMYTHLDAKKGVQGAVHPAVAAPSVAVGITMPPIVDRRPRRLSAQACAADNLLSHSIEYLTDARKLPNGKVGRLPPEEPDVQAVMMLMVARHEVYMSCPIIERRSNTGLFGFFKGADRRGR